MIAAQLFASAGLIAGAEQKSCVSLLRALGVI